MFGLPPGQFLRRHAQVKPPFLHVEFDQVTVPDERQRSADRGLGTTVQHDRTVGRAAHPRIGDAHHVHDPLFRQVSRNGQRAGFGHAHGHGTGVSKDEHVIGGQPQFRVVDPRGHVVGGFEHGGRSPVALTVQSGGGPFDQCAIGRKTAAQDDQGAGWTDG